MENSLNFILIIVFFLGIFVNTLHLDRRNKKSNCYTNKPLIPWVFSETQNKWVSPNRTLSDDELVGNVYVGDKEIGVTWEDFNK